jgi:hypothetical protein
MLINFTHVKLKMWLNFCVKYFFTLTNIVRKLSYWRNIHTETYHWCEVQINAHAGGNEGQRHMGDKRRNSNAWI